MTPEQRAAFARLADELLPATGDLPAPSSLGISERWLDRAAATRPDLADDLARALALLAPGAYYLHPRVRRLIGYPGQKPDPAPDDESDYWLRDGILDPVIARGRIWREA